MADDDRFASISEAEMHEIMENIDAANTKNQTNTAVRPFREYLTSKHMTADFESLSKAKLDNVLSRYYVELRNKKGEMYKKSTLIAYRHGIQRHLEKTTQDIDILKGEDFKKSAIFFKGMTKELKKAGKAVVEHYPHTEENDLKTMYAYVTSNLEDPQLLQYQVFFIYYIPV
jgi:hypothetical protein